MDDRYVTIGNYMSPIEARLAAGRLQDEGIPAFLLGEESANVLVGMGGLGGPIQLQVRGSDAEQAQQILAEHEEAEGEEEEAPILWVCTLCDEAVREDRADCPVCQTPRISLQTEAPRSPVRENEPPPDAFVPLETGVVPGRAPVPAWQADAESEADLPPLDSFLGDDLARRAFLSSVFGCMIVFLVPYSIWLLSKLFFYEGNLSARGTANFYAAGVLTVLSVWVWGWVLGIL